ncbi:phospholipid scramblase 1-like isoform X2 [Lineus longissimus]|uniref:phospholipid scramblase 1-like isoform X2 n=1 Tax=Lineus longissimus TaxID=88925 RepID=UPI002B4F3701
MSAVEHVEMQPASANKGGSAITPPGLEYLAQIDQLLIHQQVELVEVLTGFHCNNKYAIKNAMGQQIYFAAENTEMCQRLFCGAERGFLIDIIDNGGQVVGRITREFKCCYGCCWCATTSGTCHMEIVIESPVGTPVGYVRLGRFCCNPVFYVMNANKEDVFMVTRSCCMCQWFCCTDDLDFNMFPKGADGNWDKASPVGKVSKQWAGCFKEGLTNANNFSANFPMDLDVKMKFTMFGLAFLIDFYYFEDNDNDN